MAGKTNPKVRAALDLMEKEGLTAYAAAKQCGAALSSVTSALARAEIKRLKDELFEVCPTCKGSGRVKR